MLLTFCEWTQGAGLAGKLVYIVFLGSCVALGLPIVGALEIVPGFLFGFRVGFLIAVTSKILGNAMALALVHLFRARVRALFFVNSKRFQILERVVRRGGFSAIVAVRLMYAPMALKNYGLGLLDVPRWQILAAGALTALPFAALWAYIGTTANSLVSIFNGGNEGGADGYGKGADAATTTNDNDASTGRKKTHAILGVLQSMGAPPAVLALGAVVGVWVCFVLSQWVRRVWNEAAAEVEAEAEEEVGRKLSETSGAATTPGQQQNATLKGTCRDPSNPIATNLVPAIKTKSE